MLTIIRKQSFTASDLSKYMKQLLDKSSTDENVRSLAVNIIGTNSDNISTIFDWVHNNIKYTPDPVGPNGEEIELFISPSRMVRDYNEGKPLTGDCDDMALTMTALYRALGLKANILLLNTKNNGFDHAIVQVYSEKTGEWYNADATGNMPLGWQQTCFNSMTVA